MTKKSLLNACLVTLLGITSLGFVSQASAQPDFNGLWFPASFDPNAPRLQPGSRELPFNETALRLADEYAASFDLSDEPGGFCVKPGLPRSVWGAPFPVEIVQTEGFINMLWEGYFQYRKIYLEGHPRPEPILNTRMGYSVGHFEGDTLVIETSFLREYPYMRRTPNTDDATVVERWNMVSATNDAGVEVKYMTNEMFLTDSKLYSEPVRITGTLRFSPDTPIMEYSCSEQIYDQHLQERGINPPDFSEL
jgi:hypothetical protein